MRQPPSVLNLNPVLRRFQFRFKELEAGSGSSGSVLTAGSCRSVSIRGLRIGLRIGRPIGRPIGRAIGQKIDWSTTRPGKLPRFRRDMPIPIPNRFRFQFKKIGRQFWFVWMGFYGQFRQFWFQNGSVSSSWFGSKAFCNQDDGDPRLTKWRPAFVLVPDLSIRRAP